LLRNEDRQIDQLGGAVRFASGWDRKGINFIDLHDFVGGIAMESWIWLVSRDAASTLASNQMGADA
jgi:hypothetical protein